MNSVAMKMLMGDTVKYLGMILGVAIAAFLMAQQLSIFTGLMSRTFGFIRDTAYPDAWVMDEKVQFVDDLKPMQDTVLYRVRGMPGVSWAVPMYKGLLKARLSDGTFQNCNVIGIDDATLIGGPPKMLEGKVEDLRRADGVIVDDVGRRGFLAKTGPNGEKVPLQIGDTIELNDRRAVVVGICEVTRTFQSQPVIYTTYTRATQFAPRERKLLSFVLVGVKEGEDKAAVIESLNQLPGLDAMNQGDFSALTVWHFVKNTGIPINFGISTALGVVVGTVIVGMMFFQFVSDNIKNLGALKAMGTSNLTLIRMTMVQATVIAAIGLGIGLLLAGWMGMNAGKTELAFRMIWQIPVGVTIAIFLICYFAAAMSLIRVLRLEPGIVFR
jgi:putative ABC transport system permease protein